MSVNAGYACGRDVQRRVIVDIGMHWRGHLLLPTLVHVLQFVPYLLLDQVYHLVNFLIDIIIIVIAGLVQETVVVALGDRPLELYVGLMMLRLQGLAALVLIRELRNVVLLFLLHYVFVVNNNIRNSNISSLIIKLPEIKVLFLHVRRGGRVVTILMVEHTTTV